MLYNNNNKLSIALSICSLDSNHDIIWVYSNDDTAIHHTAVIAIKTATSAVIWLTELYFANIGV
jgi:hypothetical protein